jgi:hypothetical protein
MSKIERFSAAPAQIGNSRGYRIDAALFQAHPEMREGHFEAAYLGEGTLLLRPRPSRDDEQSAANTGMDPETDPVMTAYLAWTERAMAAQPELLRPMTAQEFTIAEALVAYVQVDLEHDRLPDDFELP